MRHDLGKTLRVDPRDLPVYPSWVGSYRNFVEKGKDNATNQEIDWSSEEK